MVDSNAMVIVTSFKMHFECVDVSACNCYILTFYVLLLMMSMYVEYIGLCTLAVRLESLTRLDAEPVLNIYTYIKQYIKIHSKYGQNMCLNVFQYGNMLCIVMDSLE